MERFLEANALLLFWFDPFFRPGMKGALLINESMGREQPRHWGNCCGKRGFTNSFDLNPLREKLTEILIHMGFGSKREDKPGEARCLVSWARRYAGSSGSFSRCGRLQTAACLGA